MAKIEQQRVISGGDAFVLTAMVDGTLGTGDSQAQLVVPFDCIIRHAQYCLRSNGDTSGNTDVTLAIAAVDLNAAAGGRLAHDASVNYKVMTLTTNTADAGDVIDVDIDAVPGTASAGLLLQLFCERRIDR